MIRVSPKEVRKKVNRFPIQAQVDWQLELGVITKSYDPSYLGMEASDVSWTRVTCTVLEIITRTSIIMVVEN